MTRPTFPLMLLGLSLIPIPAAPADDKPSTTADAPRLRVEGQVAKPLTVSADQLAALPRKSIRARDHQGRDATFEGVPLVELLKQAGVPFGKDLRGPALALYAVVEASDGYRAVFALPELDPECTDRVVLLADRRDGKPLDAKEGPLRIVVPGEKRHVRWVRQVIAIRVGKA